jgi:hypothetical protein
MILASSLPNTADTEDKKNHPHYTAPVMTFIGHTGAAKTHASGHRSFEVTCIVYNSDNRQQPHEFAVRCFLEKGPRWDNYPTPHRGSLVYICGTWIGRFAVDAASKKPFQPAILVTGGIKSLGERGVPIALTATDPATPSRERPIPRFAPLGYSSPPPLRPLTPMTPSLSLNAAGPSAQQSSLRVEDWDVRRDTASDSDTDSYQTLPMDNSRDRDSIISVPSSRGPSHGGVLGAAIKEEHIDMAADESPLGLRKRRRVGK